MTRRNLPGRKGAVCWEGPSDFDGEPIVVVATSVNAGKALVNKKTGDLAQVWILPARMSPLDSMRTRDDSSVCGDCKLRPQGRRGGLEGRACYVNPGMPDMVWKAWQSGKYPPLRTGDLEDRPVRLGAWGDPAAVPFEVWGAVLTGVERWVGYTHAWRFCDPRFRKLVMASVDTPEERTDAAQMGWRTFRTRLPHEALAHHEIACPATPEGGEKTTCVECVLCDGVQYREDTRRDVAVVVHGWSNVVGSYRHTRTMLRQSRLPIVVEKR